MELRPFELKIIEEFRRMGYGIPLKGFWIREHLKLMRTDYPYNMFKKWQNFCDIAAQAGVGIRVGTYQAFRTYFYLLTRLGLVLKEKEILGKHGRKISLYRLNPARIMDLGWRRPFQILYPKTDWTIKTTVEKRSLRQKYRPPGRRRGRPPKYLVEEAVKKAEEEWRRRARRRRVPPIFP